MVEFQEIYLGNESEFGYYVSSVSQELCQWLAETGLLVPAFRAETSQRNNESTTGFLVVNGTGKTQNRLNIM